jgi:hypothetical protein
VYAPLTDARFQTNASLENRAQSLTAVKVDAGTVIRGQ